MSVYPYRSLGELLQQSNNTIKVKSSQEYRTAGMYSYGKGLFAKSKIKGSETSYTSYSILKEGQFVYSRLFAWEGALAVVPAKFDGFHVSNEFPSFEIDESQLDLGYMKYIAQWPSLHSSLTAKTSGLGSRRQRVSVKNMMAVEIPLPDLDEQRRIAAKLDTLQGKVQHSLALIERSSELRTQILDAFLREVGASAPMAAFLSKSEDLVNVIPENRYDTAGLYSYGRGLFRRPNIYGSETKYPRYNRLHHGQFVYSKLFAWEGSAAVVPEEFEGVCVSPEFPTFDIDASAADPKYVFHLTRWPELRKRLSAGTSGMGSRRQRVNVNQLLATEVPLPDLPTQRVIAEKLDKLGHAETEHPKQEQHLKALRSSLLNAAFSGEL